MQNCSNCYDGCVQITSDRCVKYTGIDVPVLGILKGDSLSYVEQALITFLTSTLNGTGITIDIDEELYCELVSQYLQECSTVTALDLFKALVQAACNLQEQIDAVAADIAVIEADYTLECLEGVAAGDGTHAIVQAVITKLCVIDESLAALAVDIDVNYVKISDLNGYIQAYLDSIAATTRYSNRMVPYTAVEYYGSLGNFDATGAGLPDTEWEQIYLCNGLNGTPDKRGRAPVGAIVGVPGGAMSSIVDPASDATFNPNYAVGDVAGANKQTLTIPQIPVHAHGVTDPTHTHVLAVDVASSSVPLIAGQYVANQGTAGTDSEYSLANAVAGDPSTGKVASSSTGISLTNTGGGAAHDNKQPVLACYYIMYLP
jgi:microcystin-dependent protein